MGYKFCYADTPEKFQDFLSARSQINSSSLLIPGIHFRVVQIPSWSADRASVRFHQACLLTIKSFAYPTASVSKHPHVPTDRLHISQIASMPSLLRRLPKELRGPILKEAMRWEGSSPALLVALRGDKSDRDMYEEALGWFNATNIFSLSSVKYVIRLTLLLNLLFGRIAI